jgi:hypothetical protein
MKHITLSFALAATLGTGAFAQETVTTEKTVTSESPAGTTVRTEKTETTTYETRAIEAYRTVGIPQDVIVRLRDYDTKIVAARRANDLVKVREYYTAQRRLLTPDQIEKVRVHLRERPVTEKQYITVWEDEPVVTREVRTETRPVTEIRTETRPASEVRIERREVAPATTVREEVTVRSTTE